MLQLQEEQENTCVEKPYFASCLLGRGIWLSSAKNLHSAGGCRPATAGSECCFSARAGDMTLAVAALQRKVRRAAGRRTALWSAFGNASRCAMTACGLHYHAGFYFSQLLCQMKMTMCSVMAGLKF